MSHPPPYTSRMKNKNKVSLCSESDTSAVSLTPCFSKVQLPPSRPINGLISTVYLNSSPRSIESISVHPVHSVSRTTHHASFLIFLPTIFLPHSPKSLQLSKRS